MPKRHVIVVDTETNGLDPEHHEVVEAAWHNMTTGESGLFVPRHNVSLVLATADVKALQINRYIDRIATAKQDDGPEAERLWRVLDGSTLAGSNPAFDAAMLTRMFKSIRAIPGVSELNPSPWHHRLWDLSAYAAGVLGLDELPGLARVCSLLDVPPPDHTAEGDVTATALCFRELMKRSHPALAHAA